MGNSDTFVPITREFLREFYERNPFEPGLSPRVAAVHERRAAAVGARGSGASSRWELLRASLALPDELPLKMDANLMMNREQSEELELLLAGISAEEPGAPRIDTERLRAMQEALQSARRSIEEFQSWQTARVTAMVNDFLPKDFRGDLVRQQKVSKDAARAKEMEALIERGGSIQEKFELLARQQLDKRKTLAGLGASTGIFRYLIVYVGGVPEVMLDFAKSINDDDGPMVEQRLAYGPIVQRLSWLINELRILGAFLIEENGVERKDDDDHDNKAEGNGMVANGDGNGKVGEQKEGETSLEDVLTEGIAIYSEEAKRFVAFAQDLFERSPFFITKQQANGESDPEAAAKAAAAAEAASSEAASNVVSADTATVG